MLGMMPTIESSKLVGARPRFTVGLRRPGVFAANSLSTVAVALWVLSGRGTGFTLDPVLSASASAGVGILVAAAALHVLRVVGPIGTDAATTHWLVSAPLDRRTLLRGRAMAWTGALVALGVLVARLLALIAGATSWWPLAVVGAAAGALVVALAVLGQQSRTWSSSLPIVELGIVVLAGAPRRSYRLFQLSRARLCSPSRPSSDGGRPSPASGGFVGRP